MRILLGIVVLGTFGVLMPSAYSKDFLREWEKSGGTLLRDGQIYEMPKKAISRPINSDLNKNNVAGRELVVPSRLETRSWFVDISGIVEHHNNGDRLLIEGDAVQISKNCDFMARRYVPLGRSELSIKLIGQNGETIKKIVFVERATKPSTSAAQRASSEKQRSVDIRQSPKAWSGEPREKIYTLLPSSSAIVIIPDEHRMWNLHVMMPTLCTAML